MKYLPILLILGTIISLLALCSCATGKVSEPNWMIVPESVQKKNPDTIYGRGFAETWTHETAIIAARTNAVAHAAEQARHRAVITVERFISDSNFDNPDITARVLSDIRLRTDHDFAYRSTNRETKKLKDGKFRSYYGVSVDMKDVNEMIVSSIEKEPELINHLNRASDLYNNFRNQYGKRN